jgi:FkbM family methyltransferase
LSVLELKLSAGMSLAVPATLESITTYVLLEQESWFEKEAAFLDRWLQPGMSAIDVGANLGVYTLQMARLVGPGGHVYAYEPGTAARALLERSRELNAASSLQILPFALSGFAGEGHLAFGRSSELNALGATGDGETVRITSLDIEDGARGWPSPDFVKIDAEGEEERILDGGRTFFARHSPLVMVEVKARDQTNERLREMLPAMGYRLFRQLAGEPILVPVDAGQPLDPYELNLFAAKDDRARTLSQRGLLVDAIPAFAPSRSDRKHAEALWRRQKFASASGGAQPSLPPAEQLEYLNALAAYAAWRDAKLPLPRRCAALSVALRHARSACMRVPTGARLSTLARVAWEWGARGESVAALQRLLAMAEGGHIRLGEPFWPASPRFDDIAPGSRPADWFVGAAAEQFERTSRLSTAFGAPSAALSWLCQQPFCLAEMERRRVLIAARAGQRPQVPPRLREPAEDHLNADIWRAGRVPGTILASQ